jgi:hypothetical protein
MADSESYMVDHVQSYIQMFAKHKRKILAKAYGFRLEKTRMLWTEWQVPARFIKSPGNGWSNFEAFADFKSEG